MPPYKRFVSRAQMKAAFGGYLGPQMHAEAEAKAKATPNLKDLPEHVAPTIRGHAGARRWPAVRQQRKLR